MMSDSDMSGVPGTSRNDNPSLLTSQLCPISSTSMAPGLGQAPQITRPITTCPLSMFGCTWQHDGQKQMRKIITHLNADHASWLSEPWLSAIFVNEILAVQPGVRFCGCKQFWANTAHGKAAHLSAGCNHMAELYSWARLDASNLCSLPDGHSVTPVGDAVIAGDRVLLGLLELPLLIAECGSWVGATPTCAFTYRAVVGMKRAQQL